VKNWFHFAFYFFLESSTRFLYNWMLK
jgi:hypothetical protein